ncbi:hypothetical protein G1C98_1300 [Bifidobacterium sp. DSM 109960]|uniref:Uncharacterized protein n=1 Tax=Bifidobacterium erythrocebi TaxID=2675325 RepID=A0A7Y0EUC4_9BIFI|nr:hypothetical protein [Bifidobacterium sp. DSM 109960]NMM96564.1 hypothetical protein [Bifidobacterium sp. DSM 109960]
MTFLVILGGIIIGIFLAVLTGLVLLDMSPLGHSIAAAINWFTSKFIGDLVGGTFITGFYILLVFFVLGVLIPAQCYIVGLLLEWQTDSIIDIPIDIIASALIPVLMYVFLDNSPVMAIAAILMFLMSSWELVGSVIESRRIDRRERRKRGQRK